jgi:hypothetical protein
MKKLIFCASAALVMLASCGKSEVCECIDETVSAMKEMKAAKGDEAKMKAIGEKFKPTEEKCKKLNEGKSDADKKKLEDEAKKCDGYAEMDKIMKGGM